MYECTIIIKPDEGAGVTPNYLFEIRHNFPNPLDLPADIQQNIVPDVQDIEFNEETLINVTIEYNDDMGDEEKIIRSYRAHNFISLFEELYNSFKTYSNLTDALDNCKSFNMNEINDEHNVYDSLTVGFADSMLVDNDAVSNASNSSENNDFSFFEQRKRKKDKSDSNDELDKTAKPAKKRRV